MQKPWIRTALLAGLFVLPALGMAQASERHARASDGPVLAGHDGQGRDRHYNRQDPRRDHGYDRRDRHEHKYYDKKHKKKSVKAYRKGYKHGVRDGRYHDRRHYRGHAPGHHGGYRYGHRPHRVALHYHRGLWGFIPCYASHG